MKNGALYTGQTADINKRLMTHKSGKGSKFVRAFGKFELVYIENFATRSEALKREYQIKTMTKRVKEELIQFKKKDK